MCPHKFESTNAPNKPCYQQNASKVDRIVTADHAVYHGNSSSNADPHSVGSS